MKTLVGVAFLLIVVFVGLCGYWYLNPEQAPSMVRDYLPGVEVPSPKSPVSGYRPIKFGS